MRLITGVIAFVASMFVLSGVYYLAMPIQKTILGELDNIAQDMDLPSSVKTEITNQKNLNIFLLRITVFLFALGFIGWLWANSQKVDYESARIRP